MACKPSRPILSSPIMAPGQASLTRRKRVGGPSSATVGSSGACVALGVTSSIEDDATAAG
eukprot:scaffold17018_cov60-Phaeocystis_antarctica.AAC.3